MGSGRRQRSRDGRTFLESIVERLDRLEAFLVDLHWSAVGQWRQASWEVLPWDAESGARWSKSWRAEQINQATMLSGIADAEWMTFDGEPNISSVTSPADTAELPSEIALPPLHSTAADLCETGDFRCLAPCDWDIIYPRFDDETSANISSVGAPEHTEQCDGYGLPLDQSTPEGEHKGGQVGSVKAALMKVLELERQRRDEAKLMKGTGHTQKEIGEDCCCAEEGEQCGYEGKAQRQVKDEEKKETTEAKKAMKTMLTMRFTKAKARIGRLMKSGQTRPLGSKFGY